MNDSKYIGMDVHMATTVVAVLNTVGRVVAEAILETKASTIVGFLKSQRGTVHVTFEEGTQAAWLYDLIRPHVARVIVCDPRQIARQENKADKPDARRLAELLRTNGLQAIYHGEHSTQAVKELAQSYASIVCDGTRIKNRLKAVFRGRGITCDGKEQREPWLKRLEHGRAGSGNNWIIFWSCARRPPMTCWPKRAGTGKRSQFFRAFPELGLCARP